MNTLIPSPLMPPAPLDLRMVFLSSYPPKRCGIGTYTKDLATGINNLNPDRLAEIIALDDAVSESLEYPWEVSHRVRQHEWTDYEKVLTYLNNSIVDIISIQHEYGIFGGPDGEFVVDFVRKLQKPYIVTFHTILENPTPNQKRILQELAEHARGIVVMLSTAVDILRDVYGVDPQKIVPIHHGAPDFPFAMDDAVKQELGLEDRIVMSSVNLISEGKGIEYAIEALPEVVKKYPNFLYLVVGQTHPVILAREGEAYREKLQGLVRALGLEKNVRFVNKYVSLEELIQYVQASDFYITPYEGMEQISSGSLAYAIAAGKLCLSTPYRYAREILAGGRGYLVESREPETITKALLHALEHPRDAHLMRTKCYAQGRKMTWALVGFKHLRVMEYLVEGGHKPTLFPAPNLDYLRHFSDRKGLLEHSIRNYRHPSEGYALDDNARALIVAIDYGDKELAQRYLSFLVKAEENGFLHCDMNAKGDWTDTASMGDWFGRGFWATAHVIRFGPTSELRKRATELFRKLLPQAKAAESIRTFAYILLGLAQLQELEWDELQVERDDLLQLGVEFMEKEFQKYGTPDWHWPEPLIHYDNPRIPQALLAVAKAYNRPELRDFGLQLLDFILDHTFDLRQNHFRFIGNKGWYRKGEARADFDEQPIEAGATVQACYMAYLLTGLGYYRDMAKKAFAWYHGDNIMRRSLFNAKRQSVYDGITHCEINLNQGAESTLEYLLAYTCYAKLVQEGIKHSASAQTSSSKRTIIKTPSLNVGEKRRS